MKTYQKIIILILLLLGGALFYIQRAEEIRSGTRNILKKVNLITVCDETLFYSLGNIDPRFNISREEILNIIQSSESVWEKELGKNVFEYREGAEFKINFIFDERQERTDEQSKLNEHLESLEYDKENLSEEYQKKYSAYNKVSSEYEKKIAYYEKEVDDFNEEVEKWNKKGGLSEEKYEDLKDKEKELEELKDELDAERKRINRLAEEVNKIVNKENTLVENYNKRIQTYRDKFGEATEFNQGEYDGISINIYQFHEDNDLILVLVHELGHALGINHVENSQSIMYYLMENQDLENIHLTAEDLNAIKSICKMK